MQPSHTDKSRLPSAMYLAATVVLSVVLFYPALVYVDLAGIGGYNGFASSDMMLEHGVWMSAANGHTFVYYVCGFGFVVAAALMNLPVVAVVAIRHFIRSTKS